MRSFALLTTPILAVQSSHLTSSQPPGCLISHDCLTPGTPSSVGLLPLPLLSAIPNLTSYQTPQNYSSFSYNEIHPIQPGGAVLIGHNRTIVSSFAMGKSLLYADVNGTFLPENEQINTTLDTIYDLASLTKMFTAVAAMQQMDLGRLDLNETVASYMPEFAVNGKGNITILQLFTHTSGFDADPEPPLYSSNYTTYAQRRQAIIEQAIINPPGSTYLYSDLNYMNLGLVLETITNQTLDTLISNITTRLGMTSTFFNRGNIEGPEFPFYDRIAPTEFQIELLGSGEPQRPQPVRGTVHDENAWSLNGVSGHAGLFSTVSDSSKFLQMILNNGTYGGQRILNASTVDLIFHDYNSRFPGDSHGLGFELNQYYFSGPMQSLSTAGHTGFTGTSFVIDRGTGTFWVLFANRVHPSREWSSNNIVREALGYWVARSLGREVDFPSL